MEQFITSVSQLNEQIIRQNIDSQPNKTTVEEILPSTQLSISLIWPASSDSVKESLHLYRAIDMAG